MSDDDIFNRYDIDEDMAEIINAVRGDDYLIHVKKLASLCCSLDEIAAFFGCNRMMVIDRMKTDPKFADAINLGRQIGKLSLRRDQLRMAKEGNATMLIWMGKQILNQRETNRVEINLADCNNNKERAETILNAVAAGDVSVQDGAMLVNMTKTIIDEQNLNALERINKLEKLTTGETGNGE